MKRRAFSLLPPKKGRRKHWTVRVRPKAGEIVQRSARTIHRAAAVEYAVLWVREHYPELCRMIDERPRRRGKL